jgi:hypothetical protein
MADVAQIVEEFLQLGAVLGAGEVSLNDTAEFSLEKNDTLQLVVAEETFNG